MAAQENGAGPPMATQVVGPAEPVEGQNAATLAASGASLLLPNMAPPAPPAPPGAPLLLPGPPALPNIANIVAPLAAPVVAPPIIIANLAGAPLPHPGGGFDIEAGLLGSPPRKSNIGCVIHAWIHEE